jgi:predicted  nucleic acid-binding Zn-ribbon protein
MVAILTAQCRHPARESTLRKIFLAETDGDGEEDAGSLQNNLDGAQLQLRMRENEMTKLDRRNKELEEQGKKQVEEIRSLEQSRGKIKAEFEGMRNQARALQGEKAKQLETEREALLLRTKLENYKGVEVALRGQEGALNDFLHERGAFDGRTKDLATLVIMLKQKLGEVKRERSKSEAQLKEAELKTGQERKAATRLEGRLGDLEAANRNLEADLRTAREERARAEDQLRGLGRPDPPGQENVQWDGTLEDLRTMEDDSEDEEPGGPSLPTFSTAVRGRAAPTGGPASPPLAACNILGRRPPDRLQAPGSRGLVQQYDGLGGRARDLFPGPRVPAMQASACSVLPCTMSPLQVKPLSSSQPVKRKVAPLAKGPVSKQMKTMDKFFGSFDTP